MGDNKCSYGTIPCPVNQKIELSENIDAVKNGTFDIDKYTGDTEIAKIAMTGSIYTLTFTPTIDSKETYRITTFVVDQVDQPSSDFKFPH